MGELLNICLLLTFPVSLHLRVGGNGEFCKRLISLSNYMNKGRSVLFLEDLEDDS